MSGDDSYCFCSFVAFSFPSMTACCLFFLVCLEIIHVDVQFLIVVCWFCPVFLSFLAVCLIVGLFACCCRMARYLRTRRRSRLLGTTHRSTCKDISGLIAVMDDGDDDDEEEEEEKERRRMGLGQI